MSDLFQFALGARVIILSGVQGVVGARQQFGYREPEYHVQFLLTDTFNEHGVLEVCTHAISESELAKLQPSPNTLKIGVEVDQAGLDEALDKARELNGIVKRVNRKPAKRSTRIRKRR